MTSYYKERWGFCLTDTQRALLRETPEKKYHVKIDSMLFDGHLTYGELLIKGESEKEIFLSTYICHPSMANNELSGPAVTAALARFIAEKPRHYSYRIVFVPETIGAIVYLSRHLEVMRKNITAGFVLTCIGDDRAFSYLASRYGNTLADRVARYVLPQLDPAYKSYSFLERGSDERQYCAPGIDLPVCSIMRSKYGAYPEYHASLDNLSLVTPAGLEGGFNAVKQCSIYKNTVKGSGLSARRMMDILAYTDGTNDILALSEITGHAVGDIQSDLEALLAAGLVERI